MGRWLTVRVVAWGLRGGICDDHMVQLLRKRFPHRDNDWRWKVISEAKARSLRKADA